MFRRVGDSGMSFGLGLCWRLESHPLSDGLGGSRLGFGFEFELGAGITRPSLLSVDWVRWRVEVWVRRGGSDEGGWDGGEEVCCVGV